MSDAPTQDARERESQTREAFKHAMANYPTGVAVVTTMARTGVPVGLTINSLASVSLTPLMLLWSVDRRASCAQEFVQGNGFAVHVLADEQQDHCATFASPLEDRFDRHAWHLSERNLPILDGAAAVLECALWRAIEAGDHTILLGNVLEVSVEDRDPLVYHRRSFGSITQRRMAG
jgi:flavin reductase (DIM6/NTAB) family NADH-FMN oxidoreductase RutF